MSSSIDVIKANLNDPVHGKSILDLLSEYATDITGGGAELSEYVKENLLDEFKKRPSTIVLLAHE